MSGFKSCIGKQHTVKIVDDYTASPNDAEIQVATNSNAVNIHVNENTVGDELIVKDIDGNAENNNIRIIVGGSIFIMNVNYQQVVILKVGGSFEVNTIYDKDQSGGEAESNSETATAIASIGDFVEVDGGFNASNLVNFDNPSGCRLRYLGRRKKGFRITVDFDLTALTGNILNLRIRKFKSVGGVLSTIKNKTAKVNSLIHGIEKVNITLDAFVELEKDDYIFIEVANDTVVNDITAKLGSYVLIGER